MMKECIIEIGPIVLEMEFYDTETAKLIYDQLPFAGTLQKWGQEVSFDVPFPDISLEADARQVLNVGEVGYWTEGSSITIYYGETPASLGDQPGETTPVNVFGKIKTNVSELSSADVGDFIFFAQK